MPDFSKPFVVEADASGFGLGAVLTQDNHPIAFCSCTFGPRSQQKPIYEREFMAIVLSVLRWKHYLMGARFLVKTNQHNLKFMLELREIGDAYQKWVMKLIGFDFSIVYAPGSKNAMADALSRRGPDSHLSCAALSAISLDWDILVQEVKVDPYLSKIRAAIGSGLEKTFGFHILHDRLYYKNRFVLAKSSPFIPVLLQEYHDSPFGGHGGEVKTYQRLAMEWYWDGMGKQVSEYIRQCHVC